MTERAQTEAVGVILLTAVVVVTVASAGAIVLADVSEEPTARADISITIAEEGVAVEQDGGRSIPFDDLRVVVRHGNETWRPPMNASGIVAGDGNDQFENGERWVWRQPLDTSEVTTVQVFDRGSETMLADARRYPTGESSLTPTPVPEPTATPTETATPEPTTATATPVPDTTAPSVSIQSASTTVESGETTTLDWSATDTESGVDLVDIEYTTNGGQNWTAIIRGADASGRYEWRVPEKRGEVRVRVRAADSEGNDGTAETSFTIGGKALTELSVSDLVSGEGGQEQTVSFTLEGGLAEGETVTVNLSGAQMVEGGPGGNAGNSPEDNSGEGDENRGKVTQVDYREASVNSPNAQFTTVNNTNAVIKFTAEHSIAGGETVSLTVIRIETAKDYSANHSVVFNRSDTATDATATFAVTSYSSQSLNGGYAGSEYVESDVTQAREVTVDGNYGGSTRDVNLIDKPI